MTGKELLEALMKMDPADLEREAVIQYWNDRMDEHRIIPNIQIGLGTATARELLYPGLSRYEVHPIITIS